MMMQYSVYPLSVRGKSDEDFLQALCFLKVEHLIIPSVHQKEKTWTKGFNFTRLDANMKKQIMCYNTMMFHDSIRLQKVMLSPDNGQGTLLSINMCIYLICILSSRPGIGKCIALLCNCRNCI